MGGCGGRALEHCNFNHRLRISQLRRGRRGGGAKFIYLIWCHQSPCTVTISVCHFPIDICGSALPSYYVYEIDSERSNFHLILGACFYKSTLNLLVTKSQQSVLACI